EITPELSDRSAVPFTLETAETPEIVIQSPENNGYVNTPTIAISGSIAGPAPTRVFTVMGTDPAETVEAELVGSGFYFQSLPLTEGQNQITVEAENSSGGIDPETLTLTLDTQPPVLDLTSPAAGALLSGAFVMVEGTVTDAHRDKVYINGAALAPDAESGAFSHRLDLGEGKVTLAVRAEDLAGNNVEVERLVEVDTTPPLINIDSPRNHAFVSTPTVTLAGRARDGNLAEVKVGEITGVQDNSDPENITFTLSGITLTEGVNTLAVEAVDS
ncbi:MAG: hypothetical protein GY836_02845, partial [Herbaspirillum sp.]|uniref:hypothetical protein n=1 Tax=Herbaspirillum sp. TaxID=1890675 RepID=UPI00258C5C88